MCAYHGTVKDMLIVNVHVRGKLIISSVPSDFENVQERRDKRRGWGNDDSFHVCVTSQLGPVVLSVNHECFLTILGKPLPSRYAVVLQDLRPLRLDWRPVGVLSIQSHMYT